jgi:hypothetical protein
VLEYELQILEIVFRCRMMHQIHISMAANFSFMEEVLEQNGFAFESLVSFFKHGTKST